MPALREAIREEEEQERMSNGGSGTRKKTRTKKGAKDGDERDKDRLDGRAGPRSENVVLSKSEYFLTLHGLDRFLVATRKRVFFSPS